LGDSPNSKTLSEVPMACVIQNSHWLSCSCVIAVENSMKKKESSVNKAFGSKICNSSQAPFVTLGTMDGCFEQAQC